MNNKTENLIFDRHSTRNFDPNYSIGRTDQERILRAGLRAPSPKNRQPWDLTVLDQRDDILRVAAVLKTQLQELKIERSRTHRDSADLDMAAITAEIMKDASMVVFVCYVRDESNEHGDLINWPISAQAFEVADIQSIGACIENMILMAESIGINSLWICDVLYSVEALSASFELTHPLVAAVLFGKETLQRTPRYDLPEKVKWISG